MAFLRLVVKLACSTDSVSFLHPGSETQSRDRSGHSSAAYCQETIAMFFIEIQGQRRRGWTWTSTPFWHGRQSAVRAHRRSDVLVHDIINRRIEDRYRTEQWTVNQKITLIRNANMYGVLATTGKDVVSCPVSMSILKYLSSSIDSQQTKN